MRRDARSAAITAASIGGSTYDGILDDGQYPTAVGGVQSYRVRLARSHDVPPLPFDAISEGRSILTVDRVEGDAVTMRAHAPGSAVMRIVDDSGELLDRTTFEAVTVERVEVRPEHLVQWSGPWAFHRGGRSTIFFALYDAEGRRAIDESARLVLPADALPIAWDAVDASLDIEGDELTLAIDLGAGRREITAPVLDGIDRITRAELFAAEDLSGMPTVRIGGGKMLCSVAVSGEHAVAGLAFEVSGEGPIEARSLLDPEELPWTAQACVSVRGVAAGMAAIVVRAAGVERRQAIEVVE